VRVSDDVGGFEFRDPPPELVLQTLLARQLLLDAPELPGLLLVTFVLSVDEALPIRAEDAPLVGQFFEQPLNVVEGGLRPFVVKLVEWLAGQHWRPTSSTGNWLRSKARG
jgi:hypothetical protein